jgi:Rrf2 family protein
MQFSQKCQYALRATFELARRGGESPVKVAEIAASQAIPPRFLEVILNQLKRGGFLNSWRGASGGYSLARSPNELTIGEIIRFVEGPIAPVTCMTGRSDDKCPLYGDCVFLDVWTSALDAMVAVFDHTTLQDLVDRQSQKSVCEPTYCI